MNILSYRGPGSPGGVSATLSRLFKNTSGATAQWCFVNGNTINRIESHKHGPSARYHIPQTIVDGHYRYCNEFLWPILHDLPQYSAYSAADRQLYNQFNLASTNVVAQLHTPETCSDWFVNDYQFALLPDLLSSPNTNVTTFWHIPWPRHVQSDHVEPLREVAKGLLGSRQIGFHIKEYAENFLDFVQEHCPHYLVERTKMLIMHCNNEKTDKRQGSRHKKSNILVRPLGIDMQYWQCMSSSDLQSNQEETGLMTGDLHTLTSTFCKTAISDRLNKADSINEPYILSVDRCDYTKGISERLTAIDIFLQHHPQHQSKLRFIQICQPSRLALPAYRDYWTLCRQKADEINAKWQEGDWRPICWIDTPVSPAALSALYRDARAMLITPLRDGLNLTAKEYIASTNDNPGVLILSHAAGAWQELGPHTLTVDPYNSSQIAEQIANALMMPAAERLSRASKMKQLLKSNSLSYWTQSFAPHKKLTTAIIASHKEKHAAV